jgi:MoxR-like ATPase
MGGKELLDDIVSEVGKCVVGNDEVIKLLTIALFSNGHVLLDGVSGIAKTLMAKTFANVIDLEFSRVQLTPDVTPSDIIGFYYYNQKIGDFVLKKGPIFANIVLADEINRTSPKTQSALLESMQEKTVTIDGNTFELPKPFMVIATKNPLEYEGVYSLPEAQLDRFMFKIDMNYPKKMHEIEVLKRKNKSFKCEVDKIISLQEFEDIMPKIQKVIVDEKIYEYIWRLVNATRTDPRLTHGASPRASESLLYASKAHAYFKNRDFVVPDDVKYFAKYIIPHRIKVSVDYELEEYDAKKVIHDIINKVEVPL